MKIRKEADPKFLLNDTEEENTYARMRTDTVALCVVTFILCAKQRKERDVSDEDFYRQVVGATIDRATAALLEAILDFTPPLTRKMLEASAAKANLVQEMATESALQRLENPELVKGMVAKLEAEMDEKLKALTLQPSASVAQAS